MLTLIAAAFVVAHIAAMAWAIWRGFTDPPVTREEAERADMRSMSWPDGGGFGVD